MTNLGTARDDRNEEGRPVLAPTPRPLEGPFDLLFNGSTGKVIGLVAAGAFAWAMLTGRVDSLAQRDAQADGGINGRLTLNTRRTDDHEARIKRLEEAQSGVYDRLTRIEIKLENGASQATVDAVLKEIRDWRRDAQGRIPR